MHSVRKLRCPHCGNALFPRHGVELTPVQARIFDAIQRAGPDGISRPDLTDMIYGDAPITTNIISVHVNHINAAMAATGYRIKGRGYYRIERVQARERVA